MAQLQVDGETFVMKKFRGDSICRVACYFTIMPDTADGDLVSEINGNKYLILDNRTLTVKREMQQIGGWYKQRPGPPGSLVITPGLTAISVPAPSRRFSTVIFQLSVNMETGKSFVMSFLVEKRKIVRLVDQIELPIRNKPENYGCVGKDGGDGCFYTIFTWDVHDLSGNNTVFSLIRVTADHTAKLKCEVLAFERLVIGIWHGFLIKSGFLWFVKPTQMMKLAFDGKTSIVFQLIPHKGQFPPCWNVELFNYGNYIVANFRHDQERSIWALNSSTFEWINLCISFTIEVRYGITGSAITPEGIVYLLGQTWSPDDAKHVGAVHILQFDAQKRLKQILECDRAAQAAVRNAPPAYTALASSLPPPPAYDEVEFEDRTNSNVANDEETVTRL